MRISHSCCRAVAALLAAVPLVCAAVCPPFPQTVYVSTNPNDHQCDYDDIQVAIDAVQCPGTHIVISGLGTYQSQHLTIADKSLTLLGSMAACGPVNAVRTTPLAIPAQVPIVGTQGVGAPQPVISISGNSHVTLTNLNISGGTGPTTFSEGAGGIRIYLGTAQVALANVSVHDNSGGSGGIGFFGEGSLTLDGVSIFNNAATSGGGGIAVQSAGSDHIDLTIVDNPLEPTSITHNTALGGGGISLGGDTVLRAVMAAPGRAIIAYNHASQSGGGISMDAGAQADIALPGGGIHDNSARIGAGIAVGGGLDAATVLRLFNTDADNPLALYGNEAQRFGGALYLGTSSFYKPAVACLFDVSLAGNRAVQQGSAIAIQGASRLLINPDSDADCQPASVMAQGAVDCSQNADCNTIHGNSVLAGQYADAAVIDIQGPAEVSAQRLRLTSNSGSHVVRAADAAGASIQFSQCLLDYNTTTAELVSLSGAAASFDGCTLTGNAISGAHVFAFDSGMSLTRSIVAESVAVADPAASGFDAHYLILNVPVLPTDASVSYGPPGFLDATYGNFHLSPQSSAVDAAPSNAASMDLDRRPRNVDQPWRSNAYGPRDLGAFELQLPCADADTLFCDGFEIVAAPP